MTQIDADQLTHGRIVALEAVGDRLAKLASIDKDGDADLSWALRLMSGVSRSAAFAGVMHRAGTVETEMAETLSAIDDLPEVEDDEYGEDE